MDSMLPGAGRPQNLSDMAVNDPEAFSKLAAKAESAGKQADSFLPITST